MLPLLKRRKVPLYTTLIDLGLANGLKVCLDAGDVFSAPPGATSWLDRTTNGTDFFRGTTSGADATDPTFNGMIGNLGPTEYYSFDGGDLFTYDTTNETWMQNLHKAGAKLCIVAWILNDTAAQGICGTRGAAAGNTGFTLFKQFGGGAGGALIFDVRNAGTVGLTITATASLVLSGWNFVAVSLDESVGANGAIIQTNGTQELFTSTYSSPSAGNASFTMQIGARGNADTPVAAGGRFGGFAAWEGVPLTSSELSSIYQKTRGRYLI